MNKDTGSPKSRNEGLSEHREFNLHKSLCEPKERISSLISRLAKSTKLVTGFPEIPEHVIFTYQKSIYQSAKRLINGKRVDLWMYNEYGRPFCIGQYNDVKIGLGLFWIGSSAAAMTSEEAIACGARKVFEIGRSAGLQSFLQQSDIIVVTEAIRDERTSYHYRSIDRSEKPGQL